jgi:hypothetical protein
MWRSTWAACWISQARRLWGHLLPCLGFKMWCRGCVPALHAGLKMWCRGCVPALHVACWVAWNVLASLKFARGGTRFLKAPDSSVHFQPHVLAQERVAHAGAMSPIKVDQNNHTVPAPLARSTRWSSLDNGCRRAQSDGHSARHAKGQGCSEAVPGRGGGHHVSVPALRPAVRACIEASCFSSCALGCGGSMH